MEPTHNSERLHVLDLLRGFALLGIIFVNMPVLLEVAQPETIADARYFFLTQFFVENKFFTIFSFLFGVGFYLFLSRAKAKGESAYQLFVRRMVLLLLYYSSLVRIGFNAIAMDHLNGYGDSAHTVHVQQ